MLTAVRLQNFKCFAEQVEIPFNKLTLLTGVNGGGKSSVIQALLLSLLLFMTLILIFLPLIDRRF